MLQGSLLPVSQLPERPFLRPQTRVEKLGWQMWFSPELKFRRAKARSLEARRKRRWLLEPTIQSRVRLRLLQQLDRPQRKRPPCRTKRGTSPSGA